MDQKSFFLDNGVVVRERSNELILIDFSERKGQLARVSWKILGSFANDVYFVENFNLDGQPQRLHRATFTDRSYSISRLHEVSPKFLLNFPYYAGNSDHGYLIRSLLTNEQIYSECPDIADIYNWPFVYRMYVITTSLDRYEHRRPIKKVETPNNYHISRNTWHIFEGSLYSVDSIRQQLLAVDIEEMKLSVITLTQLESPRPIAASIRFISSTGIAYIDCIFDERKDSFEVHLASCEREADPQLLPVGCALLEPPVVVEVPNANDVANARDDGIIDELRVKNEELEARNREQDRRIEDLEKKYKQLLVMMGRAGNSTAQS